MRRNVVNCRATSACLVAMVMATMPLCAQTVGNEEMRPETLATLLDHQHPRLLLVMSFDQLRTDYLTRFSDQFLPALGTSGSVGGFRWLMESGAFMANAHYTHVPTFTGPGHATILTGTGPSGSGIISNDWVTSAGRVVNCVEDPNARTVGGPQRATRIGSSSPVNLIADTVTDVLRFSTNRNAKVVGIGIKDRGSILLAGHNPNAAVWFDSGVGNWVTSTYYGSELPSFAARANRLRVADRWLGKSWDYLLPKQSYERSAPEGSPGASVGRGLPLGFPKLISEIGVPADSKYYDKMLCTPFGNELLFETAKLAIEEEELGRDLYTDALCLSFSSNDLVGHTYGPHSAEVQDLMVRTDRMLSDFLNYVRISVPGGLDNVLIALTSDHGVAPLPIWAVQSMKLNAGRIDGGSLATAAREALQEAFPEQVQTAPTTDTLQRLVAFSEPFIHFNRPVIEQLKLDASAAQRVVADRLKAHPSLAVVYTREEIEKGQLPANALGQAITNGFYPERSGDVLMVFRPFYLPGAGSTGTSHGTPYTYDTHVPIIFSGRTVRPGLYTEKVDVRDIAPTLSLLLGIRAPAASEGNILDILK